MRKIQLHQIQYHVAYHKREKNGDQNQFLIIKNNVNTWTADPFLFKYKNKIYIFAEMWMYKLGRGVIGYSEWNGKKFSRWKPVIIEDYHLSYPNVFRIGNEIYMCPESSEIKEIYLYKAIHFPEKWEKSAVLISGGKYVDTTFFEYRNDLYGFTYHLSAVNEKSQGELLLFKVLDGKIDFCKKNPITNNDAIARPAGNCIYKGEKIYRVSQDCEQEYGRGLVFSEISFVNGDYTERIIKKVFPKEICVPLKYNYVGIHTFNQNDDFQVIDLRSNDISIVLLFLRVYNKIMKKFNKVQK